MRSIAYVEQPYGKPNVILEQRLPADQPFPRTGEHIRLSIEGDGTIRYEVRQVDWIYDSSTKVPSVLIEVVRR